MESEPTPRIAIRQAEIPELAAQYRIEAYPVIARRARETQGGGFADQDKYPFTWSVYFLVDGQWAEVLSARGLRREWSSLDRLERWLRDLGFRYFWIRNDVEPADQPGSPDRPSLK